MANPISMQQTLPPCTATALPHPSPQSHILPAGLQQAQAEAGQLSKAARLRRLCSIGRDVATQHAVPVNVLWVEGRVPLGARAHDAVTGAGGGRVAREKSGGRPATPPHLDRPPPPIAAPALPHLRLSRVVARLRKLSFSAWRGLAAPWASSSPSGSGAPAVTCTSTLRPPLASSIALAAIRGGSGSLAAARAWRAA